MRIERKPMLSQITCFKKIDNISFWKDVFKINRTDSNVLASTINGVTGDQSITSLWHDHYSELLNSNNDTLYMSFVKNHMKTIDCETASSPKFSVDEIRDAILNLKSGKSAGTDSLQSEHFKYADTKLCCVLRIIFNAMFSHGYLPSKLMETIIIPIIKDKKGLVTDKDNYRPVAVTSVVSKIIEVSNSLNKSKLGCSMNGVLINHLMYADDTCIIAPSPSALYKLLGICTNFAQSNFVTFNESKTKCMCFKPKNQSYMFQIYH